jgi:hypothetical protein
VHNGLSVFTDLGWALGNLGHRVDVTTIGGPIRWARSAGTLLGFALAAGALWRRRHNPALAIGAALLAVVLCGPVVHPWYVLWGLVPVAAGVVGVERLRATTWLSVALSLPLMPYGGGPRRATVIAAVLGGAAGWVWLNLHPHGQVLEGEPVTVDAEPADHPGGHGGHHGVLPELLPRVNV